MMVLPTRPRQQRGMVLIMAMFIVVLVTTVVVSVSWRYQLHTQRNENRWHGTQARAYLEGGEQLAKLMLTEGDFDPKRDTKWEEWAQMSDPLPTDEGWIRGKIEDAQGRFDLNSLGFLGFDLRVSGGVGSAGGSGRRGTATPPPGIIESLNHVRFIRLLQTIELEEGPLDQQLAIELTAAITDWIDPDANPRPEGGAERGYYEGLDPPYFCADGPMVSVSELMIIKGMTPQIYERLKPLVVALPPAVTGNGAALNINTMPDVMFRIFNIDTPPMLDPLGPDDPMLQQLLMLREDKAPQAQSEGAALGAAVDPGGFGDVSEFIGAVGEAGVQLSKDGLAVNSNWFLFSAETLVGEQVRRSKTLMFRDANQKKVDIIRRTDANF